MSRITKGDVVRFRAINGDWSHLWNKIGIVVSKPKEKPFQLTPSVTSVTIVVDVLVDEDVYKDVRISSICLLYTSPSPRDKRQSRMPSSA